MRKFAIISSAVVVLLLLVLFGASLFLNPIVEKLRPTIAKTISDSIRQPVEIGGISASIFPSTAVEISNLKLPKGTVGKLKLKTSLSELISGAISVSSIVIADASFTAERKKDGAIVVAGLSQAKGEGAAAAPTKDPGAAKEAGNFSFDIAKAEIENFNIEFTDNVPDTAQTFRLTNLNAELLDLAPGKAGQLKLTARVLEDSPLSVQGSIDPLSLSTSTPNIDLNLTVDKISLAQLSAIAQAYKVDLAGAALSNELRVSVKAKSGQSDVKLAAVLDADGAGLSFKDLVAKDPGSHFAITAMASLTPPSTVTPEEVKVELGGASLVSSIKALKPLSTHISADKFDLASLGLVSRHAKDFSLAGALSTELDIAYDAKPSLDGTLSLDKLSASLKGKNGALPISIPNGGIKFQGEQLEINSLPLNVASTSFEISSRLSSFMVPAGNFSVKSPRLVVNELAAPFGPPLPGTTYVNSFSITGSFSKKSGGLSINGGSGELGGLNLLKSVLGGVKSIPGLSEGLLALLPPKLGPLLNSDSTGFDRLNTELTFNDHGAQISRMVIEHSAYNVTATGEVRSSGSARFNAQFRLAPDICREMAARQPAVSFLLDRAGFMVIPVEITKDDGGFTVLPDATQLLKNAAQGGITQGATQAIEKLAPKIDTKGAKRILDSLF